MLLSYNELVELVEYGVIDADYELINGASIDLRLHNEILIEQWVPEYNRIVNLSKKESPKFESITMDSGGFIFKPGMFILASTVETFNLPNDIACEFKLKSSIARAGINHLLAGFADPGWHNSRLTLELKNCLQFHSVLLKPNMKIGQMLFHRVKPVPEDKSYRVNGRYNGTLQTTMSKGV